MKIFLDDKRKCPEGWWLVRTAGECISYLRYYGKKVTELSLDHDLGIKPPNGKEETGYRVLEWIEEQIFMNDYYYPPPKLKIHTANPSARVKMELAVTKINDLLEAREDFKTTYTWLQFLQAVKEEKAFLTVMGSASVRLCTDHSMSDCEQCSFIDYVPVKISDPETAKIWVNVYLHDRCYGGPEEGGWYYDSHAVELCIPTTLDHASETIKRLSEEYSNEGRRPVYSVLSTGVWVIWAELEPGKNTPTTRPHYE